MMFERVAAERLGRLRTLLGFVLCIAVALAAYTHCGSERHSVSPRPRGYRGADVQDVATATLRARKVACAGKKRRDIVAATPVSLLPQSTAVRLERAGCFLSDCPAYVLSISGTGNVVFDGRANVANRGRAFGAVHPADVAYLVKQLEEANVLEAAGLRDTSALGCHVKLDEPTVRLTVRLEGRERVLDSRRCCPGDHVCQQLATLALAVDRTARVKTWLPVVEGPGSFHDLRLEDALRAHDEQKRR